MLIGLIILEGIEVAAAIPADSEDNLRRKIYDRVPHRVLAMAKNSKTVVMEAKEFELGPLFKSVVEFEQEGF